MNLATKAISDHFSVAAQVCPEDVPTIAAAGFKTLINNRPDGEGGPGQPKSAELERVSTEQGLRYVYLPVVSGAITPAQANAMREALVSAPTPVLAFCRSGARSSMLLSLSQAA